MICTTQPWSLGQLSIPEVRELSTVNRLVDVLFLELLLDQDWREQLQRGDFHVPPPFNRNPRFPVIAFDNEDVPHLGVVGEVVYSVVAQVVPTPCNRYVERYGFGPCGTWAISTEVMDYVGDCLRTGKGVVIHQRWRGVHPVGIGGGFCRFMIGGGLSLYIVEEIGLLPPKVEVGGERLNRYAAVLGYEVPSSSRGPPVCHLVLREYLADPPLFGVPAILAEALEYSYWIPPPPLFRAVGSRWEGSGYRHAMLVVGLSGRERREGGSINAGRVRRGWSYRELQGLHIGCALGLTIAG